VLGIERTLTNFKKFCNETCTTSNAHFNESDSSKILAPRPSENTVIADVSLNTKSNVVNVKRKLNFDHEYFKSKKSNKVSSNAKEIIYVQKNLIDHSYHKYDENAKVKVTPYRDAVRTVFDVNKGVPCTQLSEREQKLLKQATTSDDIFEYLNNDTKNAIYHKLGLQLKESCIILDQRKKSPKSCLMTKDYAAMRHLDWETIFHLFSQDRPKFEI
jgi:hypothetical protein